MIRITIDAAHLRALQTCVAGKTEVRQYIRGVFYDLPAARAVATNGHILLTAPITVTPDDGEQLPDSPLIEPIKVPTGRNVESLDLVLGDGLSNCAARAASDSRSAWGRASWALIQASTNCSLPRYELNGQPCAVATLTAVQGLYPDWRRVMCPMPDEVNLTQPLGLNALLWTPAQVALKSIGVVLHPTGDNTGQVRLVFFDQPELECVVMPMRY